MINLNVRLKKLEKAIASSKAFEDLTEQEKNCLPVYLDNAEQLEWIEAMSTDTDEQILKKYYPKYKKELFYWINQNNGRRRGKNL